MGGQTKAWLFFLCSDEIIALDVCGRADSDDGWLGIVKYGRWQV